jgi:hypothetical protein
MNSRRKLTAVVLGLGLISSTRLIAQENQSLSLKDVPVGIPTAAIVPAGTPPNPGTFQRESPSPDLRGTYRSVT